MKFSDKIRSRSEDLFFQIATRIPERFVPQFVQKYAERRVRELQQEVIRQKWDIIKKQQELQKIKEAQDPD